MIKILFVCHGNICRSPMAESVMQYLVNKMGLQDKFEIQSAATSTEEIGNGVHYGTVKKLNEMKIPLIPHKARQIRQKDFVYFDYIIAMDDNNIRNLGYICPKGLSSKIYKLLSFAGSKSNIADPWYTGNFDETYDDILTGCSGLIKYLQNNNLI